MRQLYHTPLSPFCRKARMLLREKNIQVQLVQENPWEQNLEFFALNPAGEVPVLVEPDGAVISGTFALCEYIEEAYPGPSYLGNTPGQRAEVRRLLDWFDHKFDFEATQNILFEKIYKRHLQYGAPDASNIRTGKHNLLYHLDYIGYLAGERHFLAGEMVTLADFAAAAHLSVLDYLGDVPWAHNERAKQWYAVMKSRPSLRAILTERAHGVRPPAHYENPDF